MDYTFAPTRKTVGGTKTVHIIDIEWNNRKRNNNLGNLAQQLKKFYTRNSRGQLKLVTKTSTEKVPFNAAKKNYNKAEKLCVNRNPGSDIYVIINNNVRNFSNAGNGIARLKTCKVQTACHEVGHLLGLEHSGKYEKKNNFKLDSYGDASSAMSRYSSGLLTVSQYWWNGWTFSKEIIDHDITTTQTYVIRKLANLGIRNQPMGVRVQIPGNARPAFISFQGGLRLQYGNRGGSQLIAIMGKEYNDKRFTKLRITKHEVDGIYCTFTIHAVE